MGVMRRSQRMRSLSASGVYWRGRRPERGRGQAHPQSRPSGSIALKREPVVVSKIFGGCRPAAKQIKPSRSAPFRSTSGMSPTHDLLYLASGIFSVASSECQAVAR